MITFPVMKVRLELISDFICPWCYVGKARIERIAALLKDEIELDIDIKPFILYPHIPPGGAPKEDFAKNTRPGMGRSLKYEAAAEGISINYRNIEQIPYSLDAHRLAWLVKDHQQRFELSKQFFHDYFEKGINIGEEEYLAETAKSIGIAKTTIGQFLDPDIGYSEVKQYIENLRKQGR